VLLSCFIVYLIIIQMCFILDHTEGIKKYFEMDQGWIWTRMGDFYNRKWVRWWRTIKWYSKNRLLGCKYFYTFSFIMMIKNTHFISMCVEICLTIKTCVHLVSFLKITLSKLWFLDNQICFRTHIEKRLTKYTWLQKQSECYWQYLYVYEWDFRMACK